MHFTNYIAYLMHFACKNRPFTLTGNIKLLSCWFNVNSRYISFPGYFSCKEITEEIHGMLNNEFSEFSHLSNLSNQMPNLMFGQTSASLRQLATRTIFRHCFITHRTCVGKLLPIEIIKESVCSNGIHPHEDYINFILNSTVLQALIKHLGLPRDFIMNFEVELLLHRIAHKMSQMKAMPPENIFCDSDGSCSDLSGSESTGYSEEGGDSDLEYW